MSWHTHQQWLAEVAESLLEHLRILTHVHTGLSQSVVELGVAGVMWGKLQRPSVTVDDWWALLCVGEDLAVYTVSDSQVVGGDGHCHVLTFIEGACAGDCSDKDHAVDALADLYTVN